MVTKAGVMRFFSFYIRLLEFFGGSHDTLVCFRHTPCTSCRLSSIAFFVVFLRKGIPRFFFVGPPKREKEHATHQIFQLVTFVQRSFWTRPRGVFYHAKMEEAVDFNAVRGDLEEEKCVVSATEEKNQTILLAGESFLIDNLKKKIYIFLFLIDR
ncbi:hypothetical protein CDAR_113111 [Caerostris darwini]|uniref:Uncharacterized protein n=1 Tax=Caerostris darwini TaxID=1538125 RepID=A0AAV4PY56_9ARAC|nr:hypothetical protein CDAR_113111 [Caerostris darwini]